MNLEDTAAASVMKWMMRHHNTCEGKTCFIRERAYYELVDKETDAVLVSHKSTTPIARGFVEREGAAETLAMLR